MSVTDNTALSRFELRVDGHTAFADYRITGDTMHLLHVEAPPALRGTGAAGKLMEGVANIARERQQKILPICGYAAVWLQKHKEYSNLVVSR